MHTLIIQNRLIQLQLHIIALTNQMLYSLHQLNSLQLPTDNHQLLKVYDYSQEQMVRICVLAKIKINLLSHERATLSPQSQSSHDSNRRSSSGRSQCSLQCKRGISPFTKGVLKFLGQFDRQHPPSKAETRLLFHVVSLAIKKHYSEEQFKLLFNQLTDLMDKHKEKATICLEFCIEVIATVDANDEGNQTKENLREDFSLRRCQFQRYFSGNHLNSMLMIANFFMERSVIRNNYAIEDSIEGEQRYRIRNNQQNITVILQLLHAVFTYDFNGEKHSCSQQTWERSCLIIPTKAVKHANYSEYEKWIKNTDWLQIYQHLFLTCRMTRLKVVIVDILGDMARIHMRYFKSKLNYRIHVENIVMVFNNMLEHLQTSPSSQQAISVALVVGSNLLKLTSPSVVSLFFQINSHLAEALLNNIKRFIVDQVVGEEILNAHLITYYFQFLCHLYNRARFQRQQRPLELIQTTIRQICRFYEGYLRSMISKIFSPRYSKIDPKSYRNDLVYLKEMIESYNVQEFEVYFLPFKMTKPKNCSINNMHDLLTFTCSKVERCVASLQEHKQEPWEKELAINGLHQCISKVDDWYRFTTYCKKKPSIQDNTDQMGEIKEVYQEEIQNQAEYCHLLRFTCFYVLQKFKEKPNSFIIDCNINGALYHLCNIILKLCFGSDLQEKDSEQVLKVNVQIKIESIMSSLYQLIRVLLLNYFELYSLGLKAKFNDQLMPSRKGFYYKYCVKNSEVKDVDMVETKHLQQLAKTASDIDIEMDNKLISVPFMQTNFLLKYLQTLKQSNLLGHQATVNSIFYCQTCLYIIAQNAIIIELYHMSEPSISSFICQVVGYLRGFMLSGDSNAQMISYLNCLRTLMLLGDSDLADEAINKIYVAFRSILSLIRHEEQVICLDQQLLDCLSRIDQQNIANSNEFDFIELHKEYQNTITLIKERTEIVEMHKQQGLIDKTQNIETEKQLQVQMQVEYTIENNKVSQLQKEKEFESDDIYSGYHRSKTMQVLTKYLRSPKSNQHSSDQHQIQQIDNAMEVQYTSPTGQKDYVHEIIKMVEHSENHMSSYTDFGSQEIQMMDKIKEENGQIEKHNLTDQPSKTDDPQSIDDEKDPQSMDDEKTMSLQANEVMEEDIDQQVK